MPLTKNDISTMIMSAFPDAKIELKDTAGDNNHYSAKIISKNLFISILGKIVHLTYPKIKANTKDI